MAGLLIFVTLPTAVFLQATLLANSLPGQATPNLAMAMVVAAGFIWGAAGGAIAGLWGGALMGAGAGGLAPPFACLYGLVGWLSGAHRDFNPRTWTYPMAYLALVTLGLSLDVLLSKHLEGAFPSLDQFFSSLLFLFVFAPAFWRPKKAQNQDS